MNGEDVMAVYVFVKNVIIFVFPTTSPFFNNALLHMQNIACGAYYPTVQYHSVV